MAASPYATGGLIGALAASASAGTAWVTAKANRGKVSSDSRKVDAEAESVVVTTAEKVVSMLGAQLAHLELEHAKCQADIALLRAERAGDHRRIIRLEQALRDNGIPIPTQIP